MGNGLWGPKVKPCGRTLQVGFLLLVGLAFGGGGSLAGLMNLAVQLAALAILAANGDAVLDFFRTAPRVFVILISAALLLPLLQAIPLPPALWQALPGRDLAAQSLDHIGAHGAWLPISLSVNRTLIAFFALLPGLAVFVLARQLPEAEQRRLLLLVAASGIVVVLLGAQQLAMGNRHLVLFDEAVGSQDLQGTFANRNTGGLMLNIALVALIAAFPQRRIGAMWTLGGVATAALLVIGVILTRSRSSMFLLLVPALLVLWRWWRWPGAKRSRAMGLGACAAGLLLVVGGGALLSDNQRVRHSFARFDSVEDEQRPLIWKDTIAAIQRYWPVGSGIGSFDEVFQADEALENLSPGRAARAHNDFLETALESGIVGLLLLAAWLIALARLSLFAVRRGGIALASAGTFALIALQSITDYPMRSQTLLCIAGLMLAILLNSGAGVEISEKMRPVRRRRSGGSHNPT